jgi:hypothetical protein
LITTPAEPAEPVRVLGAVRKVGDAVPRNVGAVAVLADLPM